MSKGPSSTKKQALERAVLGLRAYEKISAIEGISLSDELKRDLQSLDGRCMSPLERTRFIANKYGKTSA